jgi:3-hydroxymyristoyl/3-hydroxydecanoyl-(acyl carrier protein) dehydratase
VRFILLDRITSFAPGKAGTAIKSVALSEDFFEDHFPLAPVMPGVLMLEGMAQLSGLVLEAGCLEATGRRVKPLLSIVESAKFRARVVPGDSLEYRAQVESINEVAGKVMATAHVRDNLVADCRFVFSFHEFENALQESRQAAIVAQLMKGIAPHGR